MANARIAVAGGQFMSLSLMLLVGGCFLAPEKEIGAHPPIGLPPPDVEERALFLLQSETLRRADWPEAFSNYQLFVCNPGMTAEDLVIVRRDIPGALCLAYTSAQDVPLDLYTGNPYYDALAAMFPEEYCITDLNTDEIVRIYGYGTPYATPCFIMHQQTADALVEFHRVVTMAVPWDGFYIDQCNKVFPNHRKLTLQSITDRFDIDNNDIKDSIALLDTRYAQWRPYFTAKMRATFPGKRIIANSGGQLDDPALNGITLEGVGDRFTVNQARGYVLSQKAVSAPPFLGILWKTTDQSEQGTLLLSDELVGVYYGVIDLGDEPGQLRKPTLRHMAPPPNRTLQPTRMRDENGAPR